jgi:hypothetical protein
VVVNYKLLVESGLFLFSALMVAVNLGFPNRDPNHVLALAHTLMGIFWLFEAIFTITQKKDGKQNES